jgi:hypothetical protein
MKRILVILFLGLSCSFGQVNDANLWLGLGARLPINKNFSINYETQTRFYQNVSSLKTYYNELGLKYGIIKGLDASVKYRFARKFRDTYWDSENRFNFDVAYDYKIKPAKIRVKARLRYQVAFNRFGVVNDVIYPRIKHTGRLKLSAKYMNKDIKMIQPYVALEFFTALAPKNPISGLDAYRLGGGVTFDLPKRLEVDVKYIFEHENSAILENNHIYVIQLGYTLPTLLDTKKAKDGKL